MKRIVVLLVATFTLALQTYALAQNDLPDFSSGKLPESVNLENQFLPVKLQTGGACAICAATDLLEAAYFRETGQRINLTEAYLSYRNIRYNIDHHPLPEAFFDLNHKFQPKEATRYSTGVRLFVSPEQWKLKVAEIEKGLVADIWDGGNSFHHISRVCNGSYCTGYEPEESEKFYNFVRKAFLDARKACHDRYKS